MDWIFVSGKKIPSIRKEAIVDSRIFLRSTGRTGIICTVFLIVLFMLQIYKFYLQNQHFFARKIVQKAEKILSRKQKKGIAFFDINQASDARFHLFLRENKKCSSNANKFFRKQLFNLAAPIFIETLLVILLGTTDIIMLSRHSDETVAAVGVVNNC